MLSARDSVVLSVNSKRIEKIKSDTDLNSSRSHSQKPVSMLQKLWSQLYEMRCEDLGIKVIEKQLIRFL